LDGGLLVGYAVLAAAANTRTNDLPPPTRLFTAVPSLASDSLESDVELELQRLRAVGITRVAMVDLTRSEFGWPVVRVVIPGLEGIGELPGYVYGARAATLAVRQRGGVDF
jgi:ribosomal protein S12 methylthiotransferase accessory factor YcaO